MIKKLRDFFAQIFWTNNDEELQRYWDLEWRSGRYRSPEELEMLRWLYR